MRAFGEIGLDLDQIGADLDALERFLSEEKHRTERADILPFFKARPNLSAALGLTNSAIEAPDRVAFELDLFGDFVCDVANGDSSTNAFTLIEFEDAQEQSIFRKLDHGKSMKRWSPRFERGFRSSSTGLGAYPPRAAHRMRSGGCSGTVIRTSTSSSSSAATPI